MLVFGMLCGYAGIVLTRPVMALPVFTGVDPGNAALWPMLFVTVACGAISGFHSLISSGTTSKQVAEENHCRRIGYGAMLAEAAVAILAVIAVAATVGSMDELSRFLGPGSSGPIGLFGHGYGVLTRPFLGNVGAFVAIIILNTFIFTTLDTATRISRYLTHELFGIKNRYLATLLVVSVSGWLGLSGNWNKIWPVFGAANQLVAALALLVISIWLLKRRENVYYTAIPCAFMLMTTIGALLYKLPRQYKAGETILAGISLALLMLAGYMLYEVIRYVRAVYGRGALNGNT